MNRRIIAAGVFILSTATFLLAGRQGMLVTTGGERLSGDITETRETVSIVRKGVTTILPREEVASIDYSTFAERFESTLKSLAADDVDGRLQLARDAFDERAYDLALRAVDEAIDINPVNRAALELSRAISNQMALEAARSSPATTPAPAPTPREPAATRHSRGLSAEQINIVRQMELQAGDQVRVQFRNNARKAFVDSQPSLSLREFSTLTDAAQALQIIQRGSADLKRDVVILSDPSSILAFNRRINTAVLQGCATSQCHGGSGAGGFKLLTGKPDPSTLVTNFYLLMSYRKGNSGQDTSLFSPDELRMIDRGHARDSLLYQYALPRARAKVKHPEVRRWDGIVTSEKDRLAVDLEAWMNKELTPVTPSYGFEFSLLTPATAPAEEGQATKPAEEERATPADAEEKPADDQSDAVPATRPAE